MTRGVRKSVTVGFALAVIVLLVSGGLALYNLRAIRGHARRIDHTHDVIEELEGTLGSLNEAESSQRRFLIGGGDQDLTSFATAVAAARDHLSRARSLTVDNPPQQQRFAMLEPALNMRVALFEEEITLRETAGFEGARQHLMLGQGRQEMFVVRDKIAEMEKTERDLLARREAQSNNSFVTATVTQGVTTLIGLVLVVAAFLLAAREVAIRLRGVEALARANDELESRVVARTAELGEANESLLRSNRELEQFASVASHDLQEPLRKIQAFGDRLETRCAGELGEQGRDYLTRMLASAGRMRNLIDALLSFSRVTTKALPFAPVDLRATAGEVAADLDAQVQRTGGRIEIGELPTIDGDPLQMRQLIQNLVGNGLKFSRPGVPPVVRIESCALESNNGDVPRCEISIADNGIGFEEVYLDRIFELFQRLHGRQEYEGTGMGLAIVRKIVERHGGTITARSAPDAGATFLINLPLRQT